MKKIKIFPINPLKFIFHPIFKKKLNIGIVCHPSMGGSGISATSIANELAKKGHNVHLISYKRPFKINKNLVKIHLINIKNHAVFEYFPITLVLASKIEEVIKKEKLDLINVHYALPYSVSSYLAKEISVSEGIKIPIITTLHGTDIHTFGRKKDFKTILKFVLDNSDGIITVSNFVANQAKELGITKEIKTIYNYVDTERFKREDSDEIRKLREQFARKNERIIFHASNFRKVKRIEDIIRAFNKIKRKVPSKLILAGSGPEMPKIKQLIERLRLTKSVFLLGKIKKIEKYYSIADLFMLVSTKEGCPVSILEAMSCEVPVIATNVGGIPEIVIDKKTGFLVEKENVNDIAEKSIRILSERKRIKKMGENARQEVLQKYTKNNIISQYEDYFNKVVWENESIFYKA